MQFTKKSISIMRLGAFFGRTLPSERAGIIKEILLESPNCPPYYGKVFSALTNAYSRFSDENLRNEFFMDTRTELQKLMEEAAEREAKYEQKKWENNILVLDEFMQCENLYFYPRIFQKRPHFKYTTELFDVSFTPDLVFLTDKDKVGLVKFRINKDAPSEEHVKTVHAFMTRYLKRFYPKNKIDYKNCILFDIKTDSAYDASPYDSRVYKTFEKTCRTEIAAQVKMYYEQQQKKEE